ncbi:MAG: hypothetical protein ACWGQW_23725 [bacterium]
MTKEVKKRFPDKFGQRVENTPPIVEGAQRGRQSSRSKRYSVNDLPEQDRHIMNTIVRNGVMTQDEYLKEYFGEG